MSQENIEHVKKLIEKAKELKETTNELYETIKDSELSRRVEELAEINDTLSYFILRRAPEFGLYLHDPTSENIGVLVKRLSFEHVIYVPRGANIVDIYEKFFNNQNVLEELVSDLVIAIINVAKSIKKNVDLLDKISKLKREIEFISEELNEIYEKLENP